LKSGDCDNAPIASVSLDMDNLWSYMKIHGDPEWESRPTFLPRFVPLVLDVLAELDLTITAFVVGADADDQRNQPSLRCIADAGHEIGNHSYEHESWLHLYTRQEIETEIVRAEDAIANATGQRPRGFRGPGFSWSYDLLEVLAQRGYLFDASTLPTWIGPIARWYYFRTAKISAEDRKQRAGLFGSFSDVKRPLKPYLWPGLTDGLELLEIPVTTVPLLRTPFHLSYLLYLSQMSENLMMAYLGSALYLCRLTGTQPSILLHPLDLLSGEDVPELRFFPGMDVSAQRKRALFKCVLAKIGQHFEIVTMGEHARRLNSSTDDLC
jgi:hypothetical protein